MRQSRGIVALSALRSGAPTRDDRGNGPGLGQHRPVPDRLYELVFGLPA